jgi:hypothetical protein
MKIVISAVAIVVLMIGAPSAYAISDYQLGFKHGVSDGKIKSQINCPGLEPCPYYILEPGKGFQFHTLEFVKGAM